MRSPPLLMGALLSVVACSQGYTPGSQPDDAGGVLDVTPDASVLANGAQQQFAVAFQGTSVDVAWTIAEAPDGGSITAAGLYTAPASATGTFHVVATSQAVPQANGLATVMVGAITLSPSPATADACSTVPFTATVNGLTNTSVNWSVQEGVTGGSISPAGAYIAPATPGTYHVVATSAVGPTITATATVVVSTRVLGVQINPALGTIPSSGMLQYTATVNTSCGPLSSTVVRSKGKPGH